MIELHSRAHGNGSRIFMAARVIVGPEEFVPEKRVEEK